MVLKHQSWTSKINSHDELDQIAESIEFDQSGDYQPMAILFPTFTNLLQRAKHLLATDTRHIWQRLVDVIEADEVRYQEQLKAANFEDFDFFQRTLI